MFPTELMLVRRRKNGFVFPIFLTEEQLQYCSDVNSIFQSSLGKTSGEIDREIKNLESRSENHKIVRALAMIIIRKSSFVPPSVIPAEEIRDYLFRKSKFPVYRPEERETILKESASHFGITPDELLAGMYGDKETEQVLESYYKAKDEDLAREFNLEMLETLLSKSVSITVSNIADWQELSTRTRLSGMGLKLISEGGNIKELQIKTQISKHTKGNMNASRFSDLIKFILSRQHWSIEAQVSIENKTWGRKDSLVLQLNDRASFYLPEKMEPPNIEIPQWITISNRPINLGKSIYLPCFETKITGKSIYIFISGDSSAADDIEMSLDLERGWIDFVIVSLNSSNRVQRNNWYFFKGSINWDLLKESILGPEKNKMPRSPKIATIKSTKLEDEIDGKTIEELKVNIESLYPDSGKIIDYLESKGLVANRVLSALGYKVKWKGLDMIVVR